MQRFLPFFILSLVLISCNDGDIIVTNFDFSDQTIALCSTVDNVSTTTVNYVFYKINSDTNESLSFELSTDTPILKQRSGATPYTFNLGSSTNAVSYRMYNNDVQSGYFCNAVPPASPSVTEEYTSQEATVEIATSGTEDDNDGVDAADELLLNGLEDLDGDGIPNIYDDDDDGDNVPTKSELTVLNADGTINADEIRDTDKDGIPDFQDPDDDGDGILTRDEDADGDLNPGNDRTGDNNDPDYLLKEIAIDYNINAYRVHTYTFSDITVHITLGNIVFINANADETIRQESLDFGEYNPSTQTITITPEFNQ
ncbi:MAG: hypothetical protein V7767_03990 [Leeuwenhoekiella sp.]